MCRARYIESHILRNLQSTMRQGRQHDLQNVKKQCEFKHFKKSPGKLSTVFDVSSLFYDLQDAPVLLKRLYCLS